MYTELSNPVFPWARFPQQENYGIPSWERKGMATET